MNQTSCGTVHKSSYSSAIFETLNQPQNKPNSILQTSGTWKLIGVGAVKETTKGGVSSSPAVPDTLGICLDSQCSASLARTGLCFKQHVVVFAQVVTYLLGTCCVMITLSGPVTKYAVTVMAETYLDLVPCQSRF